MECEGSWDGAVGATDPCDICGKVFSDHTPSQKKHAL